MDSNVSVTHPVAKVATVWAALAITSWADLAAALAALYSAILILEWVWKKFVRPCLEARGWIQRIKRRKYDA